MPGGARDAHSGSVEGVAQFGEHLVSWGHDGAIRFWSGQGQLTFVLVPVSEIAAVFSPLATPSWRPEHLRVMGQWHLCTWYVATADLLQVRSDRAAAHNIFCFNNSFNFSLQAAL